jgi:ABC-type multidrug transport system ATPase subunit
MLWLLLFVSCIYTHTQRLSTGLVEATAGSCTVYGTNCMDDIATVRQNLGICPQHNILFSLLTVKEHLELFCAIKGVHSDDIQHSVAHSIAEVGLQEKTNAYSSTLR